MKKDEADVKAKKIFEELANKHDEIIKKAKEDGTWKMGLDSNRNLFIESDNEARAKLKELAEQIDE